jgi:hypothetical protein
MQMVSPVTDRCLRTLPNWLEVMNTANKSQQAGPSSNRVQRPRPGGEKGKRLERWRRCLPVSFVVKHSIKNNEELTHAGGKRRLGMLAVGAQPQIESSDGGIAANSRHGCHIQHPPDLGGHPRYNGCRAYFRCCG